MAEDSGQEKTEEPTSKRLEDSRKKGQIPRSRELNTFMILMTASTLMLVMGEEIGKGLWNMMRDQFQISREVIFDPASPMIHLKRVMVEGVLIIAPFLAIMVIVAISAPLALGGWAFSWEAMQPKLEKLDPIKGIPRLFAVRGLIELVKALLKFILIFVVAYFLFDFFLYKLIGLSAEPLVQAIQHALNLIAYSFLLLSASLVLIVMFDVPYQLWDHTRKLKMTLQEIKDEMKQTEGSPEVKGQIRRLQREMAQKRMMDEVPKADVVVTNPAHYAVALRYDQNGAGAPKLVAKGVDLIAAQIRNAATAANVPLVAAPPLSRALYYSTDLDQEIPQGLYLVVAQVLAYVFQLKTAQQNGWDEPLPPGELIVPNEFKQDA
jgi:flagellar biosynthesis protein FlhB